MAVYIEEVENKICWPAPLEGMYQLLGGGPATEVAPKLPHLGLADILFMTLVMSLPKQRRPWGIVTWMAWVFQLSRPSVYALTERVQEPAGFRHRVPGAAAVGGSRDVAHDASRGRGSHERWVINKVRALGSWYTKGLDGGSHLRTALNGAESLAQLREHVCAFFCAPAPPEDARLDREAAAIASEC